MKLKVRFLKWSAGIPVAMLQKETANRLGIKTKERINLKTISRRPKEFSTIVDIIQNGMVKKNEIGINKEIQKQITLREGQFIEVGLTELPRSVNYIKDKLNDGRLSKKEIAEIIKDIVKNNLSEAEVALFISAMYKSGMSFKETIYLIDAILASGNVLKLQKKGLIVDKHSIGGIPGNRTTPLVVSICASAGLIMPKSSSRAITSAAGTADVIEALANIEFTMPEIKKIVSKTNACMVWGGSLGMVPADSKIIQVEKELRIDPEAQLLASIMSKKLSLGAKYILIDIPYGKSAKVSKKRALELKKKFERLGKYFNKKLKVVLTDGTQPIGNGVGPFLELVDILNVLTPGQDGPQDLADKSCFLAGELFEMTKKAKKGKGFEMAKDILCSGEALKKFKEIIEAQGGKIKKIPSAKYSKSIRSKTGGKIKEINNKQINLVARLAGSPTDKAAGIYLHVHLDDKVKKRDKLLTIYAESKSLLNEAYKFYKKTKPIKLK